MRRFLSVAWLVVGVALILFGCWSTWLTLPFWGSPHTDPEPPLIEEIMYKAPNFIICVQMVLPLPVGLFVSWRSLKALRTQRRRAP